MQLVQCYRDHVCASLFVFVLTCFNVAGILGACQLEMLTIFPSWNFWVSLFFFSFFFLLALCRVKTSLIPLYHVKAREMSLSEYFRMNRRTLFGVDGFGFFVIGCIVFVYPTAYHAVVDTAMDTTVVRDTRRMLATMFCCCGLFCAVFASRSASPQVRFVPFSSLNRPHPYHRSYCSESQLSVHYPRSISLAVGWCSISSNAKRVLESR
jgi:hypothetical protein